MNGRNLFRAAIDLDTATSIFHDLRASNDVLQITADAEDYYFSSKPVDYTWDGWIDYADSITTDFSEPLPVRDVFKITPNVRRAEAVAEIMSRYPEVDALNFTGEDWYQIKSRKAAKHYALAEVCRQLGIALSDWFHSVMTTMRQYYC